MTLHCLTQLFTPAGLMADADGDGLPDGFRVRLSPGCNPGAIDVAGRLGLESSAFTPGFTLPGVQGVPVWFGPENPEIPPVAVPAGSGFVCLVAGGLVVTGTGPREGWEAARWLAATFPFAAPDGPLLTDLARGRMVKGVVIREGRAIDLVLGEDEGLLLMADKPTIAGLADEAGQVPGGQVPGGKVPGGTVVPGDLPPPGPARLFTPEGLLGSSDGARLDRSAWQVAVPPESTPAEIAASCEFAARTGVESTGLHFPIALELGPARPAAGPGDTAPEHGCWVCLADGPPDRPNWVESGLAWEPGRLTVFGAPAERAAALRRAAAAGLVESVHASLFTRRAALAPRVLERGEPVLDLLLEPEWEVGRFRRVWRERVLKSLRPGIPAEVDLRLSEPAVVRAALADEIAADLVQLGVPSARIRVLSAYKQGFHWLEEEVLPLLTEAGPLQRVELRCCRFAPAGPGGVPASGPGMAAPDGSAAPDAAVQPLEMEIRWLQELFPADELLAGALGVPVRFELTDRPQASIYEVRAWRPDGLLALSEGFSPVCASRRYMPEFPHRGMVHPPTGLLRVEQGGRLVAELAIDTDAEALWTAYQEQVLPRLRALVSAVPDSAPAPDVQPLFGALVVEATLSEEDRRLGIREEQISPMDALHEDLYFYTLDYFLELGRALRGEPYEAPGPVEPWLGRGEGGPRARVRLFGPPGARGAEAPVSAADPPDPAHQLQARAAGFPDPAGPVPPDTIIGPDDLPALLAGLAVRPGVQVWRTGLSFGGRPTWALSVTPPTAGEIAPPQKLSAWRPTLLVNARRHANEVSATNSALILAEEVAGNPALNRRVNLVISPMENVDGAALHFEMQKAHPHWKLHAARYNAVGIDIGRDCFAPSPRFGEARTLPTLWRAFLPDLIFDDHGYPSHEWVQPFSGYNSAPGRWDQSWWIPWALIYSIHHELDPGEFPQSAAVHSALKDAMAERITGNPEIEGYTRILRERYETYGRRYLPERFPLNLHRGYVCDVRRGPGGGPGGFAFRFPHLTAAAVTTEVPDETAQGGYLALCVKAHLEADRAAVGLLASRPQPVVRRCAESCGRVLWTVGRDRPFRI